jgi:DNA-binding beta-propeller fold protein YncE
VILLAVATAILAATAAPSAAFVRGATRAGYVGADPLVLTAGVAAPGALPLAGIRIHQGWSFPTAGGPRVKAGRGYVALDGSPGFPPVADPSTDTVYVPIQCQDPTTVGSCNQTASRVLDLIDSQACNAGRTADCHVVATAAAGIEPITATFDPGTDTVYVADALGGGAGGGAVTVVDGATCNVLVTSGCARSVATVKLGSAFPTALALDPATGTLYVSSPTGVVDVLDVSHCNAAATASCGAPVKSIADGLGPVGVDVDIATDTVYAANGANEVASNTVSVIDGTTCNATSSSGCGQTPATVTVGTSPQWDLVDQATNTVYVANALSGSVSLINGATCNGTDPSGCAQTPPAVLTGRGDNYLALDASRQTLFSLNQDNGTISEINVNACNALNPSGCPIEARNEQVPFSPPAGGPANSFALVPATGTAYVVNAGGESLLQPVDISACNAQDTAGCREEAPHVAQEEFFPVVDAATHTIYAGNLRLAQIDVFNANTCRASHLAGCSPVAEIPSVGPQANLDAIDDATHTLYAGNVVAGLSFDPGDTISVIDIAHCNASDASGCNAPAPQITVGLFPGAPVLNPVTHTLYDEVGNSENRLAVIDVAHCNAQDSFGCGQHPAAIAVPPGSNLTALSEQTDTIYQPSFETNTVAVINGATCNGFDHSGCGHIAAFVKAGTAPDGVLVNDATNTVYVGNGVFNDTPGSVSIINTHACNGSHPSGCARHWPTVAVGRQPQLMALDTATGDVYVADTGGAAVSVINGNACNANATSGCANPAPSIATYGGPGTIAVDPQTDTVFTDESIGAPICCGGTETFGVFNGTQ